MSDDVDLEAFAAGLAEVAGDILALNVSSHQLHDSGFAQRVRGLLAVHPPWTTSGPATPRSAT